MKDKKQIYIFWTGGWDSTYRMVELSGQEVVVQPVYCLSPGRHSNEIEWERMENIINTLKQKPNTKATFLPIKKINITDFPPDKTIQQAWKTICKKVSLGNQYIYLAEIAKQFPGIELGIEKPNGEFSGILATIDRFGKLINQNGTFFLDKANTLSECYTLFGNMTFPIIDKTEVQMLQNIRDWGYEDVMKQIWFCHNPIKLKPCGFCRPCQQKMECHMEFLLDKSAQRRYKIFRFLSKLMGKRVAGKVIREFLIFKEK